MRQYIDDVCSRTSSNADCQVHVWALMLRSISSSPKTAFNSSEEHRTGNKNTSRVVSAEILGHNIRVSSECSQWGEYILNQNSNPPHATVNCSHTFVITPLAFSSSLHSFHHTTSLPGHHPFAETGTSLWTLGTPEWAENHGFLQ